MATPNRILVIEADHRSADPEFGRELADLGYVADIEAALGDDVDRNGSLVAPRAIVVDASAADDRVTLSPQDLITLARRRHPQAYVPIVAIGADENGPSDALAQADLVLNGPVSASSLVTGIRSLRRRNAIAAEHDRRLAVARKFGCQLNDTQPDTSRPRTLYVGEPIHTIGLQAAIPTQIDLVAALTPINAETYMGTVPFDLIVLGYSCEMNAALIETWRRNPDFALTPMLAIANNADAGQIADLHAAGATDVVTDPLYDATINRQIDRLTAESMQADRIRRFWASLHYDELVDDATGVYSREFAMTHLRLAMNDARQTGDPLSIIALRIGATLYDDLTVTKAALDTVIAEKVGSMLQLVLRGEDMVARLDETLFLAVMPMTEHAEAEVVARRISAIMTNTPLKADQDRSAILADIDWGIATLADHDTPLYFIMDATPKARAA